MNRIAVAAATLATSLAAATLAFAHAEVDSRYPRSGASLSKGPKTISITFTQQLRPGAKLTVKRGSRVMARGGNDPRNVRRVRARRSSRLGRGVYTVSWTATGPDGHRLRGSWAFRVR